MRIFLPALCGFVLDLLLGDPERLSAFHPVVWMGRAITAWEQRLRAHFPRTPQGELQAGLVLACALPLCTITLSALLLYSADRLWAPLGFALRCLWCWQALAIRDLRRESMAVYEKLKQDDLPAARAAVARIVGRDTANLDEAGVARAAVETVAENFSDGVVAPMLYMLLGGAPLALCYKAINTMDSMVGYQNERYLYFGRAAARLDDATNFIPARLSALLLIAAAALRGADARGALRIWRRDRRRHASPNSAQGESAMAGALGLRLAGPASYFGKTMDKPYIGDDTRPIEAEDIKRANDLMLTGSLLAFLLLGGLRLAAILW